MALERMIVLLVANQSDCFYAWRQNVVVAHSVGVKDEQIAALEHGPRRSRSRLALGLHLLIVISPVKDVYVHC